MEANGAGPADGAGVAGDLQSAPGIMETHEIPVWRETMGDASVTRSFSSEEPRDPGSDAYRLLIVERASSRLVTLPSTGFLIIGRDPDVDIHVDDPAASRRHAKVQICDGVVRVSDCGSRNGLRVNGARVEGACDLAPGDVIGIGDVTFILRGGRRAVARRVLLGAPEIVSRIHVEIDRAIGLGRPLAVAVLSLGPRIATPPPSTRSSLDRGPEVMDLERAIEPFLSALDVAGRLSDGSVVVAFGERTGAEARAMVAQVIEALSQAWPAAKAGVVACPEDGCDAITLLAAGRGAAERAPGPGVAGPGEQARVIELGDRTLLVADPSMVSLFALIARLATANLTVLISGETGVGKEHAAFAVHYGSSRRSGPFVPVNCAAIPDTLVEGELFGHAKGAYTGAVLAKAGLFERADGGTLFLDEIGELSLSAQAKLLRALEGGRFLRLGETTEREADVRIVAATNRDLSAEVRARRFREDLFYRLGSAVVMIPPLRERQADIPVLARAMLSNAREKQGRAPLTIGPSAMLSLARYAWPGNVRELKNAMEYVAASVEHGVVLRQHLPPTITGEGADTREKEPPREAVSEPSAAPVGEASPEAPPAVFKHLSKEIEELEIRRIREALAATRGIKTRAAKLIGVPERTFRLKLRQYGFS